MTLSDGQQAILVSVSGSLIAIGALSVPAGAPWYLGFALAIAGAIGLGIKEALGTKPSGP